MRIAIVSSLDAVSHQDNYSLLLALQQRLSSSPNPSSPASPSATPLLTPIYLGTGGNPLSTTPLSPLHPITPRALSSSPTRNSTIATPPRSPRNDDPGQQTIFAPPTTNIDQCISGTRQTSALSSLMKASVFEGNPPAYGVLNSNLIGCPNTSQMPSGNINCGTPGFSTNAVDGRSVVSIVVWDDPNVVWSSFDVVVVRSVWNIHKHLRSFKEWANSVSKVACLLNPIDAIEWSLDRCQCMHDLSQRGIVCAPMFFLPQDSTANLSPVQAHKHHRHTRHHHDNSKEFRQSPPLMWLPEAVLEPQTSSSCPVTFVNTVATDSLLLSGLLRDRGWVNALVKPAVGSAPLTGDCFPVYVSLEGVGPVNYATNAPTFSDQVQQRLSLMRRACEGGKLVTHRLLRCITRSDQGELSFIFFNGMFSHCVRRVARSPPASGQPAHTTHTHHTHRHNNNTVCEYSTQQEHGALCTHHLPTDDELFFAITVHKSTLSVLNDKQIGECTCGSIGCTYLCTCGSRFSLGKSVADNIVPYMRIDIARDDECKFVLLGVEMVDPALFLYTSTTAAFTFADTIISIAISYKQHQQLVQQQQLLQQQFQDASGQILSSTPTAENLPSREPPLPSAPLNSSLPVSTRTSPIPITDSSPTLGRAASPNSTHISAFAKFTLTLPAQPPTNTSDTAPATPVLPSPPPIETPPNIHHTQHPSITWPTNPLRTLLGFWGQGSS
ncbi:hypothetical protein Pelo_6634 [Pelomyxa schiedti]|nr:hypothetical protein Pelo_6634 [Pelomyxa schiedti]